VPVVPEVFVPVPIPAPPPVGPEIQSVLTLPAPVEAETVMLFVPWKNRVPVEDEKAVPAEFPVFVIPAAIPPPAEPPPPLIVTVAELDEIDWESVTFEPPTKTIWASIVPVVPAVLPPEETPAPPPEGAEMVIEFEDWLSVMLFPPMKTIVPVENEVIAPEVLPPAETTLYVLAADAVIVEPLSPKVMSLEFANCTVPPVTVEALDPAIP
jgi:hypothetical protein